MTETAQNGPFSTGNRPYKGSSIPLWIVFATSACVAGWQWQTGGDFVELISILALVSLSVSGCLIFLSIIELVSHSPLKVTVTSHAIRIDIGSDQEVVRICDLIEIQRSQTIFTDEIVLKATADREFSFENLVDGDLFLKTVVGNAVAMNARGKANARLASFSVVTNRGESKVQQTVGRPKFGHETSSLQVSNKFSTFVLTLPLPAALTAAVFTLLIVIGLTTYGESALTPSLCLAGLAIAFASYLAVCYALFIEKQVYLSGCEIIIETSSERTVLPAASITRVWATRAGFTSLVHVESDTHGIVELRGFSEPLKLRGALHWAATGECNMPGD